MSQAQQLEAFLHSNPEIEIFEVILHDLNGIQRGKWLPREQIGKLFKGGYKMPQSSCSLDSWGRDLEVLVAETGDTDGVCMPHAETLAPVPWAERPTGQIVVSMGDFSGDNHYPGDCRVVLETVLARFKKLGLTPVVASEMEFHLLELDRDKFGIPQHSQKALDGTPALGGHTYGIDAMRDTAPLLDGTHTRAGVGKVDGVRRLSR